MSPSTTRWRSRILPALGILCLGWAVTGCGDGLGPSAVAGTYVLLRYDGRSATDAGISGHVLLQSNARVERHLGGTVAVGTFRVRRSQLELKLRENGRQSDYVRSPPATLVDGVLTLRYLSPVDGPDIVEVYRRQ